MILKPNQQEAEAACQRLFGDPRAFDRLRAYTESPVLMVTHGGDGVWIGDDSGHVWQPTRKVEHPVDICGAGDSFAAGAGLALAVTGSAHQAAWFGNLVASITIMKSGTGTATPAEVIAAAMSEVLA
jgi:sugar/nucleoside kinase (ribokinase family)